MASPPPLKSAMKHRDSTSRPPTPGPMLSPTASPSLSRVALPPTGSKSPRPSTGKDTSSSAFSLTSPPATATSGFSFGALSVATSVYTPKVSFDTFENPEASTMMFSFTLSAKHPDYVRTRSTRVFLCAASPDESGQEALDWALESLVQDGDELIVCRGVDQHELEKDHDTLRNDARALMSLIESKSLEFDPDRKLSIVVEYIAGKITDTLDRLIALYRPDSVVVGTRGRRAWTAMSMGVGFGMGSVSKYCLTHSPVPIIVVRPERKVRKAVEKRKADPKRGKHFNAT